MRPVETQSGHSLSVVIPTRDRVHLVMRAVESVLAGQDEDVELVVSDDGSSDDTVPLLRAMGHPRVRLVTSAVSRGPSAARNSGAAAARGAAIAFLDSDDVFLPGRVRRLADFFAAHPQVDCTIDSYVDRAPGRATVMMMPTPTPEAGELRHMLIAHQLGVTASVIAVRRQAFVAVGGFDERLPWHEDRDLLLRLLQRHRVQLSSSCDVHKFHSGRSVSRDFDGYVAGLDAFAGCLSEAHDQRYEDLFRYLATRGVLKAVAQGHWIVAVREAVQMTRASNLPKGFLRSLVRYRAGRRFRAGDYEGSMRRWHHER
jgi:glycosyltransferase involved in cell wall biosynthesis